MAGWMLAPAPAAVAPPDSTGPSCEPRALQPLTYACHRSFQDGWGRGGAGRAKVLPLCDSGAVSSKFALPVFALQVCLSCCPLDALFPLLTLGGTFLDPRKFSG